MEKISKKSMKEVLSINHYDERICLQRRVAWIAAAKARLKFLAGNPNTKEIINYDKQHMQVF